MNNQVLLSTLFATTVILFLECTGKTSWDVTDSELRELTEELFNNENLDLPHHVRTNFQGHETQRPYSDISRQPLLTVDSMVLATPLLKSVHDLFDNYEIDTRVEEIVTPGEYDEEEKFLDGLLQSNSIIRTMKFLSEKNFIVGTGGDNKTYKNILRDVWFSQYARQKKSNIRGSSAFEHIFLGELKSGQKLIGLHSWIFFNAAERAGLLDYWGYRQKKNFGNSAAGVASIVFKYSGKIKSSTILIGTSPELEISLYTLCYFVRPNKYCRVSMGGTKFGIQTYILNHRENEQSLGSAYPVVQ